MKLFEFRNKRPERAGVAKIEFIPYNNRTKDRFFPHRNEETIFLPENPELELFPVLEMKQFLVRNGSGYWFGGTDERPFLVQLSSSPFTAWTQNGDDGLFDALKPDLVKTLEKAFEVQALRQGDIFAVPLNYPWQEIQRMVLLGGGVKFNVADTAGPVHDTRHKLTGKYAHMQIAGSGNSCLVGQGRLEAPDHEPRELKVPHVLVQASGLASPQNAD